MFARRLAELFKELDASGDGFLDFEEFTQLLDTPALGFFMRSLEIETSDLTSLFQLLDADSSGLVTITCSLFAILVG